jgi:hypothetical protein
MNTKSRFGQVVIGALLLLSILWVGSGSGWLNSFLEKERHVGTSDRVTTDPAGEHGDESGERGRKSVRDPLGKAKSLLNIKAGETGIFRVNSASSGNELAQFTGKTIDEAPPGFPILGGLASKAKLVKIFEQAFTDGGAVIGRVGDQAITEYSAKDLHVKVEVVDKRGTVEDLRVEIRCKDSKCSTELAMYPGHCMVFRMTEPEHGWVIVYCGKDEDGPDPESGDLKK